MPVCIKSNARKESYYNYCCTVAVKKCKNKYFISWLSATLMPKIMLSLLRYDIRRAAYDYFPCSHSVLTGALIFLSSGGPLDVTILLLVQSIAN